MDFCKKVKAYAESMGSTAAAAKKIGVGHSTATSWVHGKNKASGKHLQKLINASGFPLEYWIDDTIPIHHPLTIAEQKPSVYSTGVPIVGTVSARNSIDGPYPFLDDLEPGQISQLDGVDIRALEVSGHSAGNIARPGQQIWFDAGSPGDVKDGDAVVLEYNNALIFKRRSTSGDGKYKLYSPVDGGDDDETLAFPLEEKLTEYPVVGLAWRWKNRHK